MKKPVVVGGGNCSVIPHNHQINLSLRFTDEEDIYPILKSLGVKDPYITEDDYGEPYINAFSGKYYLRFTTFGKNKEGFYCHIVIGCNDLKAMTAKIKPFIQMRKPSVKSK